MSTKVRLNFLQNLQILLLLVFILVCIVFRYLHSKSIIPRSTKMESMSTDMLFSLKIMLVISLKTAP
jgi:preprotein translocase subunit SecG